MDTVFNVSQSANWHSIFQVSHAARQRWEVRQNGNVNAIIPPPPTVKQGKFFPVEKQCKIELIKHGFFPLLLKGTLGTF